MHAANTDGETPLLAAVNMVMPQSIQIVGMLLEHGADPNEIVKSNWAGITPLMRAVDPIGYDSVQGIYSMAELLIHANADVNYSR